MVDRVMYHINHVGIVSKYYSRYPSTDIAPMIT